MKYHIVLGRGFDIEGDAEKAAAGEMPRHFLLELGKRIGATIHKPEGNPVSFGDKILAQIFPRNAQHWAMARKFASQLDSDDLIFCPNEEIGFALATVSGAKQNRPKIVVFAHSIHYWRVRLAWKVFSLRNRLDMFLTVSKLQAELIRHYLNLPEERVLAWNYCMDTVFFKPGYPAKNKQRPIIASAGRERRDYKTLAEATYDLNVDVKITGFSPTTTTGGLSFPETIPDNMSCKFYEWPEVLQLYQDADLVVVSLLENNYAAGVNVLLEAWACKKPVVVTKTKGLSHYFEVPGIATLVNPGNPTELREAITYLLNNPQEAEAQAQRAYEWVLKHCSLDEYVNNLAKEITKLS